LGEERLAHRVAVEARLDHGEVKLKARLDDRLLRHASARSGAPDSFHKVQIEPRSKLF
jgi:hypothetical protein